MTSNEEPFCGETLLKVGQFYMKNISGHIDIPICAIGSIFNLLNIIVFTKKNMISPANLILAHLAFVDLAMLVILIPFLWFSLNIEVNKTLALATFQMWCNNVAFTFHCTSIFFTVMLAVWRYIAVIHPLKERDWCNMKNTRYVVVTGYAICILLNVLIYLSHYIKNSGTDQTPSYIISFKEDSILTSLALVINGVLCQVISSIVLLISSLGLIVVLLAERKHRKNLSQSSNAQDNIRDLKMKQQTDRSITILLILLASFLITKIPIAILYLMVFNRLHSIHFQCYNGLGSILDTLSFFNVSVTFILYYIMSQNFRFTCKTLLNSICSQKDTVWAMGNLKKTDTVTEIDQI